MDAIDYLICFGIAITGALLQAAIYLKNIHDKANANKVEFSPKRFIHEDWLSITISLLTIFLMLFLTAPIVVLYPKAVDYIRFGYAFVGYFSQDIASRIFGAMNKRVNQVIDKKTTVADELMKEKGLDPITK